MTSFALAAQPPYLPGTGPYLGLSVDDPRAASPVQKAVIKETVGAEYFAVLLEPMLTGREFDAQDQRVDLDATAASGAGAVAVPLVLNEKAARGFFGNGNALGKHLRGEQRTYEVVGVVPVMKDAIGTTQAIAYVPLTRHDFVRPPGGGITIIARGHSAADVLGGVQSVVASMDPTLTLFDEQSLRISGAGPRRYAGGAAHFRRDRTVRAAAFCCGTGGNHGVCRSAACKA